LPIRQGVDATAPRFIVNRDLHATPHALACPSDFGQ
jgi:hypothetical protein